MFDVLKNKLGGLAYHFWSSYLEATSRKPLKKKKKIQKTTNQESTTNTLLAIEKFVNLQLFVLGVLQLISIKFPEEVVKASRCWLRTRTSKTPSEFETRIALGNVIRNNLSGFGKNWIIRLIKNLRKEYPKISIEKDSA